MSRQKGVLVLNNPTEDTTVSITSSRHYEITCNLTGVEASSSNPSGILPDGSATLSFSAQSGYALPDTISVVGASHTWSQSTGQLVLSSPSSFWGMVIVTITGVASYPMKGQLITMSLGNAAPEVGTQNQYRVLSINGSIAEVVAMYDVTTQYMFDSSTNVYGDSNLDSYLMNTFYPSLSSVAKTAISNKTFTQDSWYDDASGAPRYNGYYGAEKPGSIAYTVSLGSTAYGSSITRAVYALSAQDVLDYVTDTTVGDGELQNYNIWKMLWNTTDAPTTPTHPWLRSAAADGSGKAWIVSGYMGFVASEYTDNSCAVRPALTIDLSQIEWSLVSE